MAQPFRLPRVSEKLRGVPRVERWAPPDFSNLGSLAAALEKAHPDTAPVAPLRMLGEGFFSVAVATASGAVFRLGTSPDVLARYEKEWRLLPWLGQQELPTPIPEPRWLVEASDVFPFGGIGYLMLPGRSFVPDLLERGERSTLAREIAAFNLAMHQLPVEEARAIGLSAGREVDRAWDEAYRDASLVALRPVLDSQDYARLIGWWDRSLADPRMSQFEAVVVHGDIGAGNLLVDERSHLIGVLDFEHATVGDVMHDFRQLRFLGEGFLDEVLSAYSELGGRLDLGIAYRMERARQLSAFGSILRAWGRGERTAIIEAPARLREVGVL